MNADMPFEDLPRILRLIGAGRAYGRVAAEFAKADDGTAWIRANHERLIAAEDELKDASRALFDGEERGHFFDPKKVAAFAATVVPNREIPF